MVKVTTGADRKEVEPDSNEETESDSEVDDVAELSNRLSRRMSLPSVRS